MVPRVRGPIVHRARLVTKLEGGTDTVLTLLSAPLGYGKTTLVVDWLRSESRAGRAVAWMSLDAGDNDLVQFTRLLVAAVRSAMTNADDAVAAVQVPAPSSLRQVWANLINDLLGVPHDIILVLDEYHYIHQRRVHEMVEYLLKQLPPRLRVVLLCREDPPFHLAQLRAHRALCELRVADLWFNPDEVAAFFREVMDRPLSSADAAMFESQTEGWIAGLQLVALSMRSVEPFAVMEALRASNPVILDLLTQEVLAGQPPAVRKFLMRTSVLERLSGPLCEAVLAGEVGKGKAQALLEAVARANLFLVPLDADREWYRYHKLFAELLQGRLRRVAPRLARVLHNRAARWYEAHGFAEETIRHALAASSWHRAARLIGKHGFDLLYLGRVRAVLAWFDVLPAELIAKHPLVGIVHAIALYGTNQVEAAEQRVEAVTSHCRGQPGSAEARMVEGTAMLVRALIASSRGDLSQSVALAAEAAAMLPASDPSRAYALVWAATAFKLDGNVTSGMERALTTATDQARAFGGPLAKRIGLTRLAEMYMLQGHLSRAAAALDEADLAMGPDVVVGAPIFCFVRAELLRQRNDLEGAALWGSRGMDAVSEAYILLPHVAADGHITLARVHQAVGDHRGAADVLDALVALAHRRQFDGAVLAREAAARAYLWLMQGNLADAVGWATASGLSPAGEISFSTGPEYLVFARVLAARHDAAALPVLDALLHRAESDGRFGSALEVLVVRALAHQALGDELRALQDLERALMVGEREGYIRVFLDEGAPMAMLLRRGHTAGIAPDYAATLLSAFGEGRTSGGSARSNERLPGEAHRPANQFGGDPLSTRERGVAQLAASGASNAEIATQLFITVGTVKKHIHHIFRKMNVKSRAQLIATLQRYHEELPRSG